MHGTCELIELLADELGGRLFTKPCYGVVLPVLLAFTAGGWKEYRIEQLICTKLVTSPYYWPLQQEMRAELHLFGIHMHGTFLVQSDPTLSSWTVFLSG